MTKAAVAIILVTIGVIGLVMFLAIRPTSTPNLLGEEYADLGRDHIGKGQSHPSYNSNPPSSGWHYAEPASWGFYNRELEDEQLIHNLEHGGVWIAYKPDVDQETKDSIKRLVERYSSKVIATPRSKNEVSVTLVSWGRVMKLEKFDKDQTLEFIKRNKNHAPEQIPD